MAELEAIGIWTEIKLRIIQEYASAYTTILKEKSRCRAYAYVDAFAGGGEFVSKEDRNRLIPGSPLNALNVPHKFTEYHFVDIDLFSQSVLIKKIRGNDTLKEGFIQRLKAVAGFPFVPEPILMHNKEGGQLYFLFFASHQKVADGIARSIFTKYRGIA